MGIIKKGVVYLKKHGIKRTIRHVKIRLEWMYSRVRPYHEPIHDKKGPLNRYEYKYYRFIKNRRLRFDVSFDDFHVDCVPDLVSIILPADDDVQGIEAAAASVLAQTYPKFELIIVGRDAEDKTLQAARHLCEQDERIRIVHGDTGKRAKAINLGLVHAAGEWCTWIGSDMRLHSGFLETMVGYLKRNRRAAACYANMRAVDENGRPDKRVKKKDGRICLPDASLRLNQYPENVVGKAFMCASAAIRLAGMLDSGFCGEEDYDLWMRLNDFFDLRHVDSEEILCDCRLRRGESAPQKEAMTGSVLSRLMLTEDYRQDWLLRPTCWVFDSRQEMMRWQSLICGKKSIAMVYDEAIKLQWPQLASGLIQVTTANGGGSARPHERIVRDAIRVLVREDAAAQYADEFDFVVQIGEDACALSKDCVCARNQDAAFDLVQIFAKAKGFDMILAENRKEAKPERKATIVLCTYKRVDAAENALRAMISQDFDAQEYEILVVNNDPQNRAMQHIVHAFNETAACAVRYIDCPYPGLSSARNFSMYAAQGAVLLYVDDDGIMESDCLSKLIRAFDAHPDAGVIGGQILLKDPERFDDVILPGFKMLWSERRTDQQKFFYVQEDIDFPYGCNFAIRRGILRELGGFRISYGRIGKDFAAGEETVLSYLVLRAGMRVGMEPQAIIWHDVEPSRFVLEHVRQTLRTSRMTNRLMKLDMYKESDPKMKDEKYSLHSAKERLAYMRKTGVKETELEYIYCLYDIAALEEAIEAGRRDREIMEKARAEYYGED